MMTRSGSTRSLQQTLLGVLGDSLDEGPQAVHHLGDGLEEFRLAGVAGRNLAQKAVQRLNFHDVSTTEVRW